MNRLHVLLVLPLFLCACASSFSVYSQPPRGAVTHVVIVWQKNPGDPIARQKLIDTSHTFGQIPGVLLVTAGKAMPSTRPVVDSTFDVAVMILFKNQQALQDYERHPIHRTAVKDVLQPFARKLLIYDSTE